MSRFIVLRVGTGAWAARNDDGHTTTGTCYCRLFPSWADAFAYADRMARHG